jgi:hypothetical protein
MQQAILKEKVSMYENHVLGFEVLTEVLAKSFIVQDIMPCSALEINRCFGKTYGPHLPFQRISQVRNKNEDGGDRFLQRI